MFFCLAVAKAPAATAGPTDKEPMRTVVVPRRISLIVNRLTNGEYSPLERENSLKVEES
jgi:hypothetical protein